MKINLFPILFLLCLNNLSAQLTTQWEKSFGGSNAEFASCISQNFDGSYIIVGTTDSNDGQVTGNHGSSDIWVIKCDSIGNLQWQKCLGGSNYETSWSVTQLSDNNFLIAGWSSSSDGNISSTNAGSSDSWLVKLDGLGNIIWENSFGGTAMDEAWSVIETNDHSIVFTGRTFSNDSIITGNHGASDLWVCKLDSTGTIQWQKCYGGSSVERGNRIIQTNEGGFIISGLTASNDSDVSGFHGFEDYWILKIDNTGQIEWQKCIGGSLNERAYSILQTSDHGYIVSGASSSNDGDASGQHGNGDAWVIKLDSIGNLKWQKMLGGSKTDWFYDLDLSIDGGFIATGYTRSNDGDVNGNHSVDSLDLWLVKLDSLGNLEWQECLGGVQDEGGVSVKETFDLGYVVAGVAESNNGDVSNLNGSSDFWVIKFNPISGIEKSNELNLFSIYPNPVKEKIILKANNSLIGKSFQIQDSFGKILFRSKINSETNNISITDYPDGFYFLSIEGQVTRKMTILKEY